MAIPQIDVRTNADQVILELEKYGNNLRETALVRGLNRTLTTVRLEAGRLLQPEVGLPAMQVRRQILFTRATKATLKALLRFSSKRIRLTRYAAKQLADGVHIRGGPKYVIAKPTWGGKEYELTLADLRHAFIVASRRNNPGNALNVWLREGRERYPLLLLLAPSLSDAFVKSALEKAMVGVAQRRFAEVLAQELRFIEMKRKP